MVGVLPRWAGAGLMDKFLGLFFCCLGCDCVFFFSMRLPGSLGFLSLCFVLSVHWAFCRGFFASLTGPFCYRFGGRARAFGSATVLFLCPFFADELAYFIDVWAVFVCI